MKELSVIKVASSSSVKAVAGSIAKSCDQGRDVEITAIGAGAVNQAVKAIAMARGFLSIKGRDMYVAPGFTSTKIGSEERTAIVFVLKLL